MIQMLKKTWKITHDIYGNLKQNAQTPIEKLENDKLGRVLTREELNAVQWYVSEILGHSQTGTAARSIVVSGGIEYILRDFKMHANDIEWIENKKQSLEDMCRLNNEMGNMLR